MKQLPVKLFVCIAMLWIFSCSEDPAAHSMSTVPGKYYVRCVMEGVSSDVKPDTMVRRKETRDSIVFTMESVRNCCGWYDGLVLAKTNDSVLIVETRQTAERPSCDCICLFRETIALSRDYFLSSTETFIFHNKKIKQ